MRVLTHRVLPHETKKVKANLSTVFKQVGAGNALNLGDQGAAVSALQRLLKDAGVYSGAATGTFDQSTADAVAQLQKAKKLEASRVVGGKTLNALKSTEVFVKDGFAQAAKVGQSGSDVLRAERMLEKLGFRPGKADGVFDSATAAAVERYRKADHQVSDKGHSIGDTFFKELSNASRNYNHDPRSQRVIGGIKAHARLDKLTGEKAARADGLRLGEKGRAVLNVQKHLEAAGYELGAPTGTFNSRTEAATRAFQKSLGLPQSGAVDARTWNRLKNKLFAAKDGHSPAQRLGENDASVMKTEKQLKILGFKIGAADGLFGKATEKAVKAFQKMKHLDVSGAVGGGTAKALQKAVNEKTGSAAVQKILETARKHLGFHEGSGNRNPFSAALGRPPEAWCADFVSYCAKKAGLKLNTASAQGVADYLKSRGSWKGHHNPKPGDAVTFRWDGSGGWADHVGLVEKVFKKNGVTYVQTIEGNSGDQVRRKTYRANDPVINGFGTIK